MSKVIYTSTVFQLKSSARINGKYRKARMGARSIRYFEQEGGGWVYRLYS